MIKWDRPCYKCLSHFCDLSCKEPEHLKPPQRTAAEGEDTRRAWVGLTEDETEMIVENRRAAHWEFVRQVEALLKEKNT